MTALKHQVFTSWTEFSEAVAAFCKARYHPFVRANSKTCAKANKNLKPGQNPYPLEMEYVQVTFQCTHSGCHKFAGQGIRRTKSMKQGCKARIYAALDRFDRSKIVIKDINEEHNHEISQELFERYTHQRKLTKSEKMMAEEMMRQNVPNKVIQKELVRLTGKQVILQDVHNIKKALKKKEQNPEVLDTNFVLQGSDNIQVIVYEANEQSKNDRLGGGTALEKCSFDKTQTDRQEEAMAVLQVEGPTQQIHAQIKREEMIEGSHEEQIDFADHESDDRLSFADEDSGQEDGRHPNLKQSQTSMDTAFHLDALIDHVISTGWSLSDMYRVRRRQWASVAPGRDEHDYNKYLELYNRIVPPATMINLTRSPVRSPAKSQRDESARKQKRDMNTKVAHRKQHKVKRLQSRKKKDQ